MTLSPQDVQQTLDQCRSGQAAEAERQYRGFLSRGSFSTDAMVPLAELARCLGLTAEALAWAGRAVRLRPDQADAWTLYALALIAQHRVEAGTAAVGRALMIAPRSAPALRAAAVAMLRMNRLPEAAARCGEALAIQPGYADALATLALIRMAEGRAEEADVLFRQATALPMAPAEAFGNHAALLARLGRDAEALERAERAVALRPRLASAHHLLGTLHRQAGRTDPASRHFKAAIAADAHHLDARMALIALWAELGLATGDWAAEMLGLVQEVLALIPPEAPESGEVAFQLGALFLRHGRRDLAISLLRRAIQQAKPGQPDVGHWWSSFALSLRGIHLAGTQAPVAAALRTDLLAAFARTEVDPADLATAAASLILADPAAGQLGAVAGDPAAAEALLCAGSLTGLAGDPLLHALLAVTPVTDLALERIVIALRRALLAVTAAAGQPLDVSSWGHPWLTLCVRLARQAFLGDYVLAQSAEETIALDRLEAEVRHRLENGVAVPNHWIALLGAYRPLDRLPPALMGHAWPAELRDLLALQVSEVAAEAGIAAQLPCLTPVNNSVSVRVRAQYEEHPYPRWVSTGLRAKPIGLRAMLQALFPRARPPAFPAGGLPTDNWPNWEAPEVLVAGCGTGREAVQVARHVAGARVLAVDLSRRSLAYGLRQAQRLGLDTLSFAQADLLELGRLERRFDLIHCVGVLHHMADPLAGLRVLTGLLAPGGVMKLGFYSTIARRPIAALRSFAAERGIAATLEGVRRLRQDILDLPADHPARAVTASPDFFTASGCRDLMLHVHELSTSLPWLEQALDGLDLTLLGFEFEDPAPYSLYRQRFPDDPAMTSLARWTRLEEAHPTLFGRLYQFWVTRRR
ncbi:TPR repeat-containing protein (plasmid) [Azospirillum sp. B510]|uniref:class I SAM-dependent methyltransferase n=1 Tax=Azospirillum sp. (strain B510) TaxID=137722 RepID=UPI0001C4CD47|nr:class I SAM-dependent methyltransferase [Azospirillum sp. B510]BAI76928.1 TPR repeat-containing protein [Azospirillum sp. B510]